MSVSVVRKISHRTIAIPRKYLDSIIKVGFRYDVSFVPPFLHFIFHRDGEYKATLHKGTLYVYIPAHIADEIAEWRGKRREEFDLGQNVFILFKTFNCHEDKCVLEGEVIWP